jgi:uncharacterized membrane protein
MIGGLFLQLTAKRNLTRREESHMSDLIAIGYPDEATAQAAADEAHRLAKDLVIEPDAIAVIVRDSDGKFHVHTRTPCTAAAADRPGCA